MYIYVMPILLLDRQCCQPISPTSLSLRAKFSKLHSATLSLVCQHVLSKNLITFFSKVSTGILVAGGIQFQIWK